jgi:uncharacterized protein YajQ (UPF0234 family)
LIRFDLSEQAESHKKWLELVSLFNTRIAHVDLKRVFVTATPENVCMLYNIESIDVMKLEIPSNYIGYKQIKYIPFENDLDIGSILTNEVKRINDSHTFEVILYCIERKIVNGHDELLYSISKEIKCSVNTYNGKGISVIFNTEQKMSAFQSILENENIKFSVKGSAILIREIAIKKFYSYCKKAGENCIITVGKDLIARGISYVGEDTKEPLTATTMIYKPGTTLHSVGICQTIGRITGCAMPGLQRRLYAPQDVIDTYVSYNTNQEKYISKLCSSEKNELTKDIIANMVFDYIPRDIDRKKLKLKMNYDSEESNTTACEEDFYDEVKMKKFIKSWIKQTNQSKIACLFRDMVKNGGFFTSEYIMSNVDISTINRALDNSRHSNKWSLVFGKDDKKYFIRDEAMEYYNSIQ